MADFGADIVACVQLKVTCNHFLEDPNMENIIRLISVINVVHESAVQDLHGHILFVLLQKLKASSIRTNIKIKIAECMKEILGRCTTVKVQSTLIDNLLLCFIGIMYKPESENLVLDCPEELHVTCLQCICIILCASSAKARLKMYSSKRAPLLGVLVCVCLKQAASQQVRGIKIAAIECLMACGQVLESAEPMDELKVKASNIFMNFTPGIAAGLQLVIRGDEKQGHAVVVIALRAWGRLMTQVLNEEVLGEPATESEDEMLANSLSGATTSAEVQRVLLSTERNKAWVTHAGIKLAANVDMVCGVRTHPHPNVRLELANIADLLLSKCSRGVPKCVPPLLDTLLSLAEDDDNEVSSAARLALEHVAAKYESQQGKSLTEILEESFFNVASTLPAKFVHAATRDQRSRLCILLGYLRLLGPRLPQTLLLSSHLEALMSTLLQISTLDCYLVLLLEDIALRDVSCDMLTRVWCRLQHVSDPKVEGKLREACLVLAQHADLGLLTEHLLRVFSEQREQRREATLLINIILAKGLPGEDHLSLVCRVVRTYLDPEMWELPLSMHEDTASCEEAVTLASVRANVVQVCLMTEGLASLTASTGEMCRRLLSDVLYPVLERAGSPLEMVSMAGRQGLEVLATALGHKSAGQLIEKEADYFNHTLEVRLRRPQDNPGALLVLSAVLTHSSKEVLPCIQQLVSNVLVQSCDKFQEKSLTSYLQVFHTFLLNLHRWLQDDNASTVHEAYMAETSGESLLIQELRVHYKWKTETGQEELGEQMSTEEQLGGQASSEEQLGEQMFTEEQASGEEHMDTSEVEKVVPEYVTMTEAVMSRCIHALPSPDKYRQVLALSTLSLGIQVLRSHQEQLLPMVHKIWSPLLQRFSPREDVVVLRHSFLLLCTMAHVAKDFLRKRTLDKVLPIITNFLIKQGQETWKKKIETFTQSVRLQHVALSQLGQLAEDLGVQEETLAQILQAAAPYLSCNQPPVLQECCMMLFRHIARLNTSVVWVQLRLLWNPDAELTPPEPSCTTIRLPKSTVLSGYEFRGNVEMLDVEL